MGVDDARYTPQEEGDRAEILSGAVRGLLRSFSRGKGAALSAKAKGLARAKLPRAVNAGRISRMADFVDSGTSLVSELGGDGTKPKQAGRSLCTLVRSALQSAPGVLRGVAVGTVRPPCVCTRTSIPLTPDADSAHCVQRWARCA